MWVEKYDYQSIPLGDEIVLESIGNNVKNGLFVGYFAASMDPVYLAHELANLCVGASSVKVGERRMDTYANLFACVDFHRYRNAWVSARKLRNLTRLRQVLIVREWVRRTGANDNRIAFYHSARFGEEKRCRERRDYNRQFEHVHNIR